MKFTLKFFFIYCIQQNKKKKMKKTNLILLSLADKNIHVNAHTQTEKLKEKIKRNVFCKIQNDFNYFKFLTQFLFCRCCCSLHNVQFSSDCQLCCQIVYNSKILLKKKISCFSIVRRHNVRAHMHKCIVDTL